MSGATPYVTRTLALIVLPAGADLTSEMATTISLDDEGGGTFLRVRQCHDRGGGQEIAINPEEWPEIRAAVDRMAAECKKFPTEDAAQ